MTMRFEGLPGEFSQHDFGETKVTFLNGTQQTVRFFATRLKYSRWAVVTIVSDQKVETLVRTMVEHFVLIGGFSFWQYLTGRKRSRSNGARAVW